MTAVRLGPAQRLVLDVLDQWERTGNTLLTAWLVASIASQSGRRLPHSGAQNALRRLAGRGFVVGDGDRPQGFRLTDLGRAALAAARETAGGER